MTKEELIEKLDYYFTIDFDIPLNEDEVNTCIEAIEKQIPKQLHQYANGTEHCPNCDANLTGMGFKYCVECGQALLD